MKNLPIWKKATLGVSGILLLSIGIFFYNIRIVQNQSDEVSLNLNKIQKIGTNLSFLNNFNKEIILTNLGYMDAIVDKDSAEVEQDIKDQHQRFHKWFNENIETYQDFLTKEDFKSDLNQTIQDVKIWKDTADKLFQSIYDKDSDEVFAQYDDVLDGTVDKLLERNQKVINSFEKEYSAAVEDSKNLHSSAKLTQWVSISLIVVFGFFMLLYLVKSINNSLTSLANSLKKSSSKLLEESKLVNENSDSLSIASNEQASNLQATVSAIDEINSMVQRNSESAASSTETSKKSTETASRGKKTVEVMINSIKDISDSNTSIMNEMQRSNEEISKIVKVIAEIGEKTKVINDIVFQTKLLSFNASVEAARAGEHGKGFAVVAEEVGNLATMSGSAATEITEMLDASIKQVSDIADKTKAKVESMVQVAKEKIDNGTRNAQECGEALDEILQNVSSVNELVGQISVASSEQATGVHEVTAAIQKLDQNTHHNTDIASKSLIMAKSLKQQADLIDSAVNDLINLIGINENENTEKEKVKKSTKSNSNVVSFNSNQVSEKPNNVDSKVTKIEEKTQEVHFAKAASDFEAKDNFPSESDSRFEDF